MEFSTKIKMLLGNKENLKTFWLFTVIFLCCCNTFELIFSFTQVLSQFLLQNVLRMKSITCLQQYLS